VADETRPTLSRRTLLAGAAAATAATALGPLASPVLAGSRSPRPGHRRVKAEQISIQLYTLRDLLAADLDGTLEALARIGFRRVEHAGIPTGLTARQYRAKLDSFGLRATSGHMQADPLDPNAWAKAIDDAHTLGQTYADISTIGLVGFDPVTGPLSYTKEAEWVDYIKKINEVAHRTREAGLRFGMHNHFWEFAALVDSPKTGYDIVLANTDPKAVHFEIDLYWAWFGHHDPALIAHYLQDRVPQFHVKDMQWIGPRDSWLGPTTWADPGTGIIDFARIFAAKQHTEHVEFIIERDDAGQHALTTAKVGFDFLRRIRF
jgi:sugar phosphate isomerase/epimerase